MGEASSGEISQAREHPGVTVEECRADVNIKGSFACKAQKHGKIYNPFSMQKQYKARRVRPGCCVVGMCYLYLRWDLVGRRSLPRERVCGVVKNYSGGVSLVWYTRIQGCVIGNGGDRIGRVDSYASRHDYDGAIATTRRFAYSTASG